MPGQISERQLAGERRTEERRQRAIRRAPVLVVGLLGTLTLLAGTAAAVDLRRLGTPAGTTRAWVQAALSADCGRYAALSALPGGKAGPLTGPQCRRLRSDASGRSARSVTVLIRRVTRLPGHRATAVVTVSVAGSPDRAALIELRRTGGWLVVRGPSTCALVVCP